MPTITTTLTDLQELIGEKLSGKKISELLRLVKGEWKGEEEGKVRIELTDTNRPDLWSAEGIARQISEWKGTKEHDYTFFQGKPDGDRRFEVDPALEKIRPYVGGFEVTKLTLTEGLLEQLIETQERLCENFGHRRKTVSMGIYRVPGMHFPVRYRGMKPDECAFTPLGEETKMTPGEILEKHPKGIEYGKILEGASVLPVLADSKDRILSLAPIINSREIGEVKTGDDSFLVEMTGTDLRSVLLGLNIMAANLADRGGEIHPMVTAYPYETEFGPEVTAPFDFGLTPLCNNELELSEIERLLGERIEPQEAIDLLAKYGVGASVKGDVLTTRVPPWRLDLLHPVDILEDIAISRGYESFQPEMPSDFTVGRGAPITEVTDRFRESLLGLGFEEVISNILTHPDHLRERMNRSGDPGLVRIANVMSETYSAARDGILPSLLRVEAGSSKAQYPHRLFEAGEVAFYSKDSEDPVTEHRLGALIAHPEGNFSEMHSVLEWVAHQYGLEPELKEEEHPSYLPGRFGRIVDRKSGERIGFLGELHPQVLENWGIGVPCAGMELYLERIMPAL